MASSTFNLNSLGAIAAQTCDNPAAGVAGVGAGAVCFNVQGTYSATLAFEATCDGQNWFAVLPMQLSPGGVYAPLGTYGTTSANLSLGTSGSNTTPGAPPSIAGGINGQFIVPVYGYQQVRIRVSAYTSGTAVVTVDLAGSAPAGQLYANLEGLKASYSASTGSTPAGASAVSSASPTDMLCLQGAATRTVKVTRLGFSANLGSGGTTGYIGVAVVLRSATSSGTTTAMTSVRYDRADVTASAVPFFYNSNIATVGATIGVMAAVRYFIGSQTVIGTQPLIFDFVGRGTRPIVLRGTTDCLAINILDSPASQLSWDGWVEWLED